MTFINQASKTICSVIHALRLNAKGMRDFGFTEIANRMECEIDGLLMALAICERSSMTGADGIYHAWEFKEFYESE